MVFELTGVTTNELPAARALRSCLKRSWCDDFTVDGMVKTYDKRATTPARRVRLANSISVGFVRDNYADEVHASEQAPFDVGEGTATRRSGWVDDQEEVGKMALHDGPVVDSLILISLVEAFASSQDSGAVRSSIIPLLRSSIIPLLRQHHSAQLFASIQHRIRVLKTRIETRGCASLLPANVTLEPHSVALLNLVSQFVTKALHLIPCTDVPTASSAP